MPAEIKLGRTIAEAIGVKAKKRHKYGAKAVEIGGIKFPSKAEGERYCDLKQRQDLGLIMDLQVHVRFDLIVNGIKIAVYESDACYYDCETGKDVVEDTKGVLTAVFRMKSRLMKACHGIDVVVIGGPKRRKRRRKAK